MRQRPHALVAGATLLALSSCISTGPSTIAQQRGSYTEVISETDKEELLTNIVRLAYLDAPVFFQVASVTAQPSVEYGTPDSDIKLGDGSSPNPLVLAKPRVLIKDAPTIVYKPLSGKEFSSELLMPIDIRPAFLMLDNGFDFSVIAQLLFKSMNGLSNSRNASPQERERFRACTDAIARMMNRGQIQVGTPKDGLQQAGGRLEVQITPAAFETDDGKLVAQALGLDPARETYALRSGLGGDAGTIAIAPRSLLALLSYLSNYVQPPVEHASITWPTDARGESHSLMTILSSRERPTNADPLVFHEGFWFYVRADDLRSRNTLFLLRLLFNLQADGGAIDNTLQLTLPLR